MKLEFKEGDIIKHFKRDMICDEEKEKNMYLYRVITVAKHTETEEDMLVYQALYYPFGIYTRPLDMAMEEITEKDYPEIKKYEDIQKHRFEVCNEREDF